MVSQLVPHSAASGREAVGACGYRLCGGVCGLGSLSLLIEDKVSKKHDYEAE